MNVERYGLAILIVLLLCNFIIILVRDFINYQSASKNKIKNRDIKFFLKSSIFVLIFTSINSLIGKKIDFWLEYLGDFALIIWSLTIYFGILYLMMAILTVFVMYNKWLRNKFNEEKNDYDDKLIIWIGENYISERFLYKLFNKEADAEYNDIENIKKVREILGEYLEGDKLNYKLLKNHLEFKRKNEFLKKFKILSLSLVSLSSSWIIIPNIGEYRDILKIKIEDGNNWIDVIINLFTTMAGYSLIIIFVALVFSIYIFCKTIYEVFTERDRSVKYLITIIDKIIEEI
ncbi:MAG: hypothetical protein ABS938_16640 [Psychrobacillus psychrodurans]